MGNTSESGESRVSRTMDRSCSLLTKAAKARNWKGHGYGSGQLKMPILYATILAERAAASCNIEF